ncbi:hypothetical protein MMC19_003626 [Ptychographa xylographoides]|nr:hypothetical protein [Ptychographa xylographoides]
MAASKKGAQHRGADKLSDAAEATKSNGADAEEGLQWEEQHPSQSSSTIPSKRKAKSSPSSASKAPRRSAHSASSSITSPIKILRFLLSPSSLPYCRPKDEIKALESLENPSDLKTYSSVLFTPFEELASAVILSRPISHALGVRSIRTLFNAPYNFTTPKALKQAGSEGRRKALDEARTQHRQKTAEELGGLADAISDVLGEGDEDVGLEKVRNDAGFDMEKVSFLSRYEVRYECWKADKFVQEREILQKNIKGLGKTGLDIFFRRIQGLWEEAYPFVDHRTADALRMFRLPSEAEELRKLLEKEWDDLKIVGIETSDNKEKKRKAFAQILERAVGAHLEGNVDTVKAAAEE